MKTIIQYALLFFASCLILSGCCTARKISSNEFGSIDMQTVIYHLKTQYDKALDSLAQLKIPVQLTEASATLNILKGREAGGEIGIWIIKPSYKYSQEKSTSITFNMALPIKEKMSLESFAPIYTNNDLKDAIVAAAVAFDKIPQKPIDSLLKSSFDVEVVFSIKREEGISLEFDVFGTTSIGANHNRSRQVEHTMKLSFKPKK